MKSSHIKIKDIKAGDKLAINGNILDDAVKVCVYDDIGYMLVFKGGLLDNGFNFFGVPSDIIIKLN